MELKVAAVKEYTCMPISKTSDLMNETLCRKDGNFYKRQCIEGNCGECGIAQLLESLQNRLPETMKWKEWKNVTEMVNNKKVTRKWSVQRDDPKEVLIQDIKKSYNPIIKHVHEILWQQDQISKKRAALKWGEVMFGMDFAEKWRTEWQWEVSSAHYGYKLVTVFPIVAHYLCTKCPTIVKEAIVIVSDERKNNCDAVASYVDIALHQLKTRSEVEIQKQIWVTDQCRAQFKGCRAFYRISQRDDNIHHVYYAAGHGKSLSDGEGAVVKRYATDLMKAGQTHIENAKDFAKACDGISSNHTNSADIHNFHKANKAIRTVIEVNDKNETPVPELKAAKGTSTFFSVLNVPGQVGVIKTRNATCFCDACEQSDSTACENSNYVDPYITHNILKDKTTKKATCGGKTGPKIRKKSTKAKRRPKTAAQLTTKPMTPPCSQKQDEMNNQTPDGSDETAAQLTTKPMTPPCSQKQNEMNNQTPEGSDEKKKYR